MARGGRSSWKSERAGVNRRGASRSRTNKYSGGDSKSQAGDRSRIWVGGYKRSDGTRVEGYYRGA